VHVSEVQGQLIRNFKIRAQMYAGMHGSIAHRRQFKKAFKRRTDAVRRMDGLSNWRIQRIKRTKFEGTAHNRAASIPEDLTDGALTIFKLDMCKYSLISLTLNVHSHESSRSIYDVRSTPICGIIQRLEFTTLEPLLSTKHNYSSGMTL
jgi:hypothetical protein